MPFRWNHLTAAALLVALVMIWNGVPLGPVLAGCAIAALLVWWRKSPRRTADR